MVLNNSSSNYWATETSVRNSVFSSYLKGNQIAIPHLKDVSTVMRIYHITTQLDRVARSMIFPIQKLLNAAKENITSKI